MTHSLGPVFTIRYLGALCCRLRTVARQGNLMSVDDVMPRRIFRFQPLSNDRGVYLDLAGSGPSNVFSGAREMYCRRVYWTLPGFEVRQNDVVVDLGANMGLFTTLVAVAGSRVIAVEAQSGFLEYVQRNLELSRVARKADVVLGLMGTGTGVLAGGKQAGDQWEKAGLR